MTSEETISTKWKFRFGSILSLAAVATIGTTYLDQTETPSRRLTQFGISRELIATTASSTEYVQNVIASNEYGESIHGTEYPWMKGRLLVEPHKQTTLEIVPTKTTKDLLFEWTFVDPSGETLPSKTGSSVSVSFSTLGKHAVSVNTLSLDGSVLSTYSIDASCVYVKRELRKLTEEDRENFLDAMHEMWNLGSAQGRAVYGKDFTGIDRYVYIHTREASGDIECDKWHEGSGFLAHHLALAVSFDLSLQSIDKRVTTPYWDFTIEGEKLNKDQLGPKSLTKYSPLMSDSWFGVVDGLDHVVSSRWAHTKSIKALKGSPIKNSYGYIRAPWNNGKDRELVRHYADVCGLEPVNKPIPSCATHFKVMNGTSLPDFLLSIAGYGHGPMHVNTGGVFGECTGAMSKFYNKHYDTLQQKVSMESVNKMVLDRTGEDLGWSSITEFSLEEMVQKFIHLEYFHIYRTLWRSQTCALDGKAAALSCPSDCDDSMPESECMCTCAGIETDGTVTDSFDWQNLEPCLYGSDTSKTLIQNTLPDFMRKELVVSFCSSGVKEGEMLESASPLDPLFWMIHPVLDRMLVAKRLSSVTDISYGGYGNIKPFVDEEWLDYSFYTTEDKTCDGHNMYDAVLEDLPLPQHLINSFDTNNDGVLSNIEFYEAVDPTKEEGIGYVFDHFTWNHCETDATSTAEPEEGALFINNVGPSKWEGESYKDLKQVSIKASKALKQHRNEVENGLKPGKSLAKQPKVVGGAEDFFSVINLLESNEL